MLKVTKMCTKFVSIKSLVSENFRMSSTENLRNR